MYKTLISTFTAFALTASTAAASPGLALENIVIRDDAARVEYSSKIVGCGVLADEDGYRLQKHQRMFCDTGLQMEVDQPMKALDLIPGEWVKMCQLHDPTNCTEAIEVREAGDLNGDLAINVADLYIMHTTIVHGAPEGWPAVDADELAADMNGDGEINIIDILLLIEVIQGDDW
jgi:hypothetical protein